MASTNSETRVLEHARQRLLQLSNSLSTIRQDLEYSDPLPDWDSIQKQSAILASSLTGLQTAISGDAGRFLSSAHAYPLPSFPGQAQEAMLLQLLRKKLEPKVEDLVAEGQARTEQLGQEVEASELTNGVTNGGGKKEDGSTERQLTSEELNELWEWAGPHANSIARKFFLGGGESGDEEGSEYESEGEEEEEAEGEKSQSMEGVVRTGEKVEQKVPLYKLLRFMSTGVELGVA